MLWRNHWKNIHHYITLISKSMSLSLSKVYTKSDEDVIKDILACYDKQLYAIVNFLYFANAMQFHLFEEAVDEKDVAYKDSLERADFLLPDGIALQLWHYISYKTEDRKRAWVSNLNGTDLTPKLLFYLTEHYTVTVFIASLYDEKIGKGRERLDKAVEKLKKEYHIPHVYAFQTHYTERGSYFPRHEWEDAAQKNIATNAVNSENRKHHINLVLHCTGTPFQEVWTESHREWYKSNRMLVVNAGWFIDFFVGFEKRAPKWVIKARVLETFWRIITNPEKNLKKFLAMFWIIRILWRRAYKVLFPFVKKWK